MGAAQHFSRFLLGRLVPLAALLLSACSDPDDGSTADRDPPRVSSTPGGGPAQWVDPFIGSADSNSPDPVGGGKGGSTFPGAALPFGLVQFSPDTNRAEPAGYAHAGNEILGFSLTHLNGAGCNSLRDFPVFPSLAAPDATSYPSASFSHDDELASPGFYEVMLGSGILVDLTATERTGLARFTFPDSAAEGFVTLSAGTRADLLTSFGFSASVKAPDLVTGARDGGFFCGTDARYRIYFAARFDRPSAEHGSFVDAKLSPGASSVSGKNAGVYFRFDTRRRHVVHIKLGLSFVSEENALANLDAENDAWDFDAIHAKAVARWNELLSRVRIDGGTDDERRMFYTALYHVLLQPAVASDVTGEYVGFDGQVHHADDFDFHVNFSGWDVYRSWIQLVAIVAPEKASQLVRSLVESAGQCGALPKWSLASDETGVMVGDPAAPTIANAHAFGASDFDAQAALAAMLKNANEQDASCNGVRARPGNRDYLERHFCPIDGNDGIVWGPPATTLEYAIADFSIARLALALGDDATAADFAARGGYWQNVFDAGYSANDFTGYVQPRLSADAGGPQFAHVDVGSGAGFVEGNATQYTFMVPQDVHALVAALGGDATSIARLDALFTELNGGVGRPYFYMGNEPQFATPWLYPWAGAPWKTDGTVRRIVREVFSPGPEGLPGNDDLGATSAWLVWAMLGLYPVVPGVGGFVVSGPLFPETTIELASGNTIVIRANGAAADAPFVQSLSVDGQQTSGSWLAWDVLREGATLELTLAETPNQARGVAMTDRPPSFQP